MNKFFIYGGITLGSIIGAYIPVILFGNNPLGVVSVIGGILGSFVGLWVGYKASESLGE